jgi:transcriptional accessory protein Tex/SPT6
MTFWEYLEQTKQTDFKGLSEATANQLSELIGRGHSVADLLGHYADDFGHLPAAKLQSLAAARRAWQAWRRRRHQFDQARKEAKLPPLPEAALKATCAPHELDALVRTARLCPRDSVKNEAAWVDALRAGTSLWRAALGVTRKEAKVECKALDHQQAASHYDDYVGKKLELGEAAAHRWLALRRGAKERVLQLSIEPPKDSLLTQVELVHKRLGPLAQERSTESLLEELVLDDLEPWLLRILDQESESEAILSATQSLAGLLNAAPLQVRRIGAIFVALRAQTKAVGVVVADREGELLAQRVLKIDGQWVQKALSVLGEYNVHHIAIPASAPPAASELYAEIEREAEQAGLQLARVRAAALAEARLPLTDPPTRLGVSVASALVLARRVLDPVKEWAAVDPVAIGVAEYQNDLNEERLRAALKETVELCKLERRRGTKGSSATAPAPRAATTGVARLNPLVKNIADLRGGMSVHGIVTNISHFGAFVNIGLPQEALVHISELSDNFVSNPNEVVSIGQQVTAHVLSVDPPRGRISLSMKTMAVARPRAAGNGPQRSAAAVANKSSAKPLPKSRSEALANLERLFKK